MSIELYRRFLNEKTYHYERRKQGHAHWQSW